MRRLFTNMGWLLGGRGVNAALSLIYLALATRSLGPEGFGHFAIIVALGQAITGLGNFQTWQFIVRWGANGLATKTGGSDHSVDAIGFAIALDLLSVVMGLAVTGVVLATAQYWLEVPDELLSVTFAYCAISLVAIRTTPTGILRLHFKYASATAAEAVQPIIRALGAGLAFVFMPNVTGFVLAFAASEIGVAAALWWVAARTQRIDLSRISFRRIPAQHRDAWRFVLSTNMSGSLSIAGKQVMILLVGTFGGAALAGGFRVASQLGQALVSLAQTVSKAILPELVHAGDNAVDLARRMANIAAIGGVIAVVIALVFGRWGISLIAGDEFQMFYWAMVILAIAGAIELVGASLESLLVSAGKAHTAFIIRAVPTVLALVLLEIAIDWSGAKGAAVTMLGSSLLAVMGFYIAILNLAQIRIVVAPESEGGEPQPAPSPKN
jgi:O-antigen/teichoic acid export membrane protein